VLQRAAVGCIHVIYIYLYLYIYEMDVAFITS